MRISDWSSDVCSSDLLIGERQLRQAGQLESADLDFARGLAFALYGHGIDEEFVMSRIENMRRQFHGHAIIDCFYAFPGRDGFETKFGCRSEGRRVGKEGVSTCRSRWSPDH